MRLYHLAILVLLLSSCSLADNCGDCEINKADIINIGFINSTDSLGNPIGPQVTFANTSITYCGCPDMNNTVIANSTDLFGHAIGPRVAYEKVNLAYFAGLDISKVPRLITDMDVVGPDLVLVEYDITVTNIGQVNVTGIKVVDPRLGNFSLGKLMPGKNITITPDPYYIITPDDVSYCWIKNVALATGKDRCCKTVGPVAAYANFPLSAKNLEIYLKKYSYQLLSYGHNLKENGNASNLQDFEEKIRIQANRLMVMGDAIKGNASSCLITGPLSAAYESTDALDISSAQHMTPQAIDTDAPKCANAGRCSAINHPQL